MELIAFLLVVGLCAWIMGAVGILGRVVKAILFFVFGLFLIGIALEIMVRVVGLENIPDGPVEAAILMGVIVIFIALVPAVMFLFRVGFFAVPYKTPPGRDDWDVFVVADERGRVDVDWDGMCTVYHDPPSNQPTMPVYVERVAPAQASGMAMKSRQSWGWRDEGRVN